MIRYASAMTPTDPGARAQLASRTIEDFGRQWTHFQENEGWYASVDFLRDVCGPLLDLSALQGARVAEIGSGTGRIVRMLLEAGAAHVFAVEPSAAMDVLRRNLADVSTQVTPMHVTGEGLPAALDLDFVFSIGVLHHVPDPDPVVAAARAALRPGGRILVWLYGHEGNGLYLALARPLRALTTRLPRAALLATAAVLDRTLDVYRWLCRKAPASWPLPLRGYLLRVLDPLTRAQRRLVIYDQLNPSYARYYRAEEARALLERNGFREVRLHHRHGYSWTVIGEKP